MKSYTDLPQSKKLAEFLPIESADMYFSKYETTYAKTLTKYDITHANVLYGACDIQYFNICEWTPCWSLAALFDVLPDEITDNDDVYRNMFFHLKGKYVIQYPRLTTLWPSLLSVEADNPVDACVAMIVKLYEQKLI